MFLKDTNVYLRGEILVPVRDDGSLDDGHASGGGERMGWRHRLKVEWPGLVMGVGKRRSQR